MQHQAKDRPLDHRSPELHNLLQGAAEIRHRRRDMRQPHLIHDAFRPGVNFTLGVIDKFKHKAVPHQVGCIHPEWLGKL